MRNLFISLILAAAASPVAAAPVAACPAQEMGLSMLQNFSYHRRWSEYCGVAEAEIIRQVDSSITLTTNNCLRPQHVAQGRIEQSLKAGRDLADRFIAQMPDKAAQCERIKHSYDRGK